MPDAIITITAKTMEGLPLEDPQVTIEIREIYPRYNTLVENITLSILNGKATLSVPWAGGYQPRWQLVADMSLFDPGAPYSFFPGKDVNPEWQITAARLPNKWKPIFAPIGQLLSSGFDALKGVLKDSVKVDLKTAPDHFFDLNATYDSINSPAGILAKAALLNIYAVLSELTDPLQTAAQGHAFPWFSHVQKIVRIDQERFVAEVDAGLFESVDFILNRLNSTYAHQGYSTEPAADFPLHYPNIPTAYGGNGAKRPPYMVDIITLKKAYQKGDVQLTVSFFRFPDGTTVHLLDCDMDENINIVGHSFDLLRHLISHTGTTPIYMHEFIVEDSAKQSGGISTIDLGYELQVA